MKIIKPHIKEIVFHIPEGYTIETWIERAGRNCYKSENKITEESAPKFVKMLRKRGHWAMIEHCMASAHLVADRGMTHELVRHRLCSYAQECVSGDMEIKKGLKVKDIAERHKTTMGAEYNRRLHLKSMDENGIIFKNRLVDIWSVGTKKVYEIKTKLGYSTKTTKRHKFICPGNKEIELRNLKVGDYVLVNGRPSLLKIDDEELEKLYLDEGFSPIEISEKFCVSYRIVLNKLKKLGIFKRHLNDKNPEKYNKNHTRSSYEKMRKAVLEQYKNGRRVWNKGLRESSGDLSVKRQADNLRKFHHDNGFGKGNSNWKGGVSRRTAYRKKINTSFCEICGVFGVELEVHHLDFDEKNNKKNNLKKCCRNCHDKFHHGWYFGMIAHKDEIVSIEYVGKEEVYDIEMKAPYHNFVGDGFVTHNSTRYCSYNKGKFDGEITVIEQPGIWCYEHLNKRWIKAMEDAEKAYMDLIKEGAKPQEARSVLPIAVKSEIIVSANLRQWNQIFQLRCDTPAHPIIRGLFIEILKEFNSRLPSVYEETAERFLK